MPSPILRADPILLRFDATPVRDLRTRTFTISNVGSAVLDVSLPASLTGHFRWAETFASISSGGVEHMHVDFNPQSTGEKAHTLFLESNAPGSPHPVALQGTGLAQLPL